MQEGDVVEFMVGVRYTGVVIEKRTQPQSIEVNKLNESNVDDLANFPEAARAMIEKDIALIVQTSEKLRQSKTQLIDQLEELTRFKSQIEEILSSVIQEEGWVKTNLLKSFGEFLAASNKYFNNRWPIE